MNYVSLERIVFTVAMLGVMLALAAPAIKRPEVALLEKAGAAAYTECRHGVGYVNIDGTLRELVPPGKDALIFHCGEDTRGWEIVTTGDLNHYDR